MTKSILLVGVGGQGTILISKILTVGLTRMGYQVKMSEIHGMSQRGGSVSTQIKYGDDVYAPNIGLAEAEPVHSSDQLSFSWSKRPSQPYSAEKSVSPSRISSREKSN